MLSTDIADAFGISRTAAVSRAPQGMTSEVVFIDDGERRLVLKGCRDARYANWLRREHQVLAALASTDLRMPRVIGYRERECDDGSFDVHLLTTRVPGESFWDAIRRSSGNERAGQLFRLGRFLQQLHSTPPPEAFHSETSWIDRKLDEARRNLSWCDGSPELLNRLAARRPSSRRETLIHGDLALDNVLLDRDGTLGLVDWAAGDLGDPRYDVSLALATEPEVELRDVEVAAFFDGYGTPPLNRDERRWFQALYEFF